MRSLTGDHASHAVPNVVIQQTNIEQSWRSQDANLLAYKRIRHVLVDCKCKAYVSVRKKWNKLLIDVQLSVTCKIKKIALIDTMH